MGDRSPAPPRTHRSSGISLDIVICTPHGRRLAVLLVPAAARARERWMLPWTLLAANAALDDAAADRAAAACGVRAAWIEQIGAFGDGKRHPSAATVSIACAAVTPSRDRALPAGARWFPASELPAVAPRQRAMIDTAVGTLRVRMDSSPIAFRLLPPTFTLTELQEVYEMLLGRRVHKASFRRSLQAAWLVEPTDEWRSEGRGRPAQLYRYAPRKRRGGRRGVRFELLGD
jgi:8-oxo-dGTP diphosphatase